MLIIIKKATYIVKALKILLGEKYEKNRSLAILSGSLIFCLGIYILFQGGTQITEEWKWSLRENLVRMTERSFMPGLFMRKKKKRQIGIHGLQKKSDADDSAWKLCGRERNL